MGGIEGLSLTPTPILAVHDNNEEVVTNLGIGDPWVASKSITSNSQSSVQVLPNTEITFIGWHAILTDTLISHPGIDYVLTFTCSHQSTNRVCGKTVPFDVPERELVISVIQSSQKGSAVLCLTL